MYILKGVKMGDNELKEHIKDRYSKIATNEKDNSCKSCSTNLVVEQAKSSGYTMEDLKSIPENVIYGLGCGNPTALVELKKGDVVLDLGSGSGIDVFLAANKVGKSGKVIGLDMTEEMIETAKNNAKDGEYENVEFKLGEIEDLPIKNDSIDVIISNCVINLTPNKLFAYEEALRVLKPGGKILISDLVTDGELPEEIRHSFHAWSECTAGALEKEEYINIIRAAGFSDVEIVKQHYFTEYNMDERLIGKIISIQVKATK